jgi:hypothetical protein
MVVLEAGQRKLVCMYHAGLLRVLKGRKPENHGAGRMSRFGLGESGP